ncbi:MAG: rhomboid family intramembrane serine protease [Chitinophagales bacterium]
MQTDIQSIWKNIKYYAKSNGIVSSLITINVGLFILQHIVYSVTWLMGFEIEIIESFFVKWLYLPDSFQELLYKPYTIITFQFMHSGFFHLAMNMLLLYFSSRIFSLFLSSKKILPLYLLGGIAGGLLCLLAFTFSPVFENSNFVLLGASASVMAIMGACVITAPNFEMLFFFFLRVKLKYLVLVIIAIDILTLPNGNAGGNISHLGGLAFGALFIYLAEKKGVDIAKPFNKIIDSVVSLFKKKPKVVFTTHKRAETTTPITTKNTKDEQEKIDAILDKISANGYESLTKAEKEYLFAVSKKKQ